MEKQNRESSETTSKAVVFAFSILEEVIKENNQSYNNIPSKKGGLNKELPLPDQSFLEWFIGFNVTVGVRCCKSSPTVLQISDLSPLVCFRTAKVSKA